MKEMTSVEQAKVVDLVKRIFDVAKDEDTETLTQALVCCLFGTVRTAYGLSDRDAVEFCAKHIKTYAQFVWS